MEMSSSGAAGAVPKLEHPPAREARRCRVLLVAGLVALPLLAFFVLGQESASTVWEMASATFTVVLEPVRDLAWRYYKHFHAKFTTLAQRAQNSSCTRPPRRPRDPFDPFPS